MSFESLPPQVHAKQQNTNDKIQMKHHSEKQINANINKDVAVS